MYAIDVHKISREVLGFFNVYGAPLYHFCIPNRVAFWIFSMQSVKKRLVVFVVFN
jgi:hypothetical protein